MDEIEKFTEKLNKMFSDLLTYEAGWGDDDSNVPFSPSFLERIKEPILNMARLMVDHGFGVPSVGQLDDNSIDAFWNTKNFNFLVNIGEYDDGLGASLHGLPKVNGTPVEGGNEVEWAGELGKEHGIIKKWLESMV